MRALVLIGALAIAAACSAVGVREEGYPFTVKEAEKKLLTTKFPKGALEGWEGHNVTVQRREGGMLEWNMLVGNSGQWCPSYVVPVNPEGTRVRVDVKCAPGIVGNMLNPEIEKLVDKTLSAPPTES